MMNLKGRNFLKLMDYTPEEILYLIDLAADLKKKKKKGLTDFVYKMYDLYHVEAIENAYMDLDSLIATGQPAW